MIRKIQRVIAIDEITQYRCNLIYARNNSKFLLVHFFAIHYTISRNMPDIHKSWLINEN